MQLCVDFCGGYCSFLVNYSVGLEKAGLRVNRELSQAAKEKDIAFNTKVQFLKRSSTDFDKKYIFRIGTSSAIEWYLSFLLSISWPSDEPCVQPTIWHISKKTMTRWHQRSRLKVTLSDLTSSCVFRSLTSCQRQTSDPNSLKLAVYSKDIGVYNLYISDFFISVTLGHVNFVTSPF